MGMFDAFAISGSGMTAERLRMDVIAGNLANADSTQGANGQSYRRRLVVLQGLVVLDRLGLNRRLRLSDRLDRCRPVG